MGSTAEEQSGAADVSVKKEEEPAAAEASVKREPETDENPTKRARVLESTPDIGEESPDFTAEMSGLSDACIACLPEDAPSDSLAYLQCKWVEARGCVYFEKNKVRVQASMSKTANNRYAAFRLVRHL